MSELEWNVSRDDLIAEVHEAFRDVSREGGVSWSEAEVIDDYGGPAKCAAARKSDRDTHWSQLLDDPNWNPAPGVGGFSFLDPIGFRYYLPVVMIRSLRSGFDEGFEFYVSNSAVSDEPSLQQYRLQQQALLNESQRRCIQRVLLYLIRMQVGD